MKCDNCKEYPVYILKPGTEAEQLFCVNHLPSSLAKKATLGQINTVMEFLETMSRIAAQAEIKVEETVVEEQPAKKSKKKAVAEPEQLPVIDEAVVETVTEEPVVEEAVAEAVVDESDNSDSN